MFWGTLKSTLAALIPIFLHQNITNPNCNHTKAAKNTLEQKKLLVKCP